MRCFLDLRNLDAELDQINIAALDRVVHTCKGEADLLLIGRLADNREDFDIAFLGERKRVNRNGFYFFIHFERQCLIKDKGKAAVSNALFIFFETEAIVYSFAGICNNPVCGDPNISVRILRKGSDRFCKATNERCAAAKQGGQFFQ